MEKNEGRKNLTVTVRKSVIVHIHAVLNLGHCRRNTTDGSDLSSSFSQILVGWLCSPISRWDTCTELDWIQHIHLSPASGMEAVICVCAQLAIL